MTVSLSGNAFSTASPRGRLSSALGQPFSRQNPRRYPITASIWADVSSSANDGMMRENPRPCPPK
jgi:hypothetical protein